MKNTISILIIMLGLFAMYFCIATNELQKNKQQIADLKNKLELKNIEYLNKTMELISCEENE